MSGLDVHTLLACLAAVNVFLSLAMTYYWRTQRVYPGFGLWTACNATLAVVYVLLFLRGSVPTFVTIVVANDLAILAAILRFGGMRRFLGSTRFDYWTLLVPALAFLFLVVFTYVREDQYARTAVSNVALGLTVGSIAWLIVRRARGLDRLFYVPIVALFALYATLFLARASYWVLEPEGSTLLEPNAINILSYLLFILFDIGVTLAFLTLNHQRTAQDLERAQEAAETGRNQMAEIIAFLPDATCAVDATRSVVAWNRAAEELTGVPAEQVLGRPYDESVAPILDDRRPTLVDLALDTSLRIPDDYPLGHRDGAKVTAEFRDLTVAGRQVSLWKTAIPLREAGGGPGGAVESIRDITRRTQAEAELREAKERFEVIFSTSPDATVITRLHDGVVVDINDGFTALTGFTRDDAIGPSSLELHLWKDPADRQAIVGELDRKGFCSDYEAVFQRKDGSERMGSMSARVITLRGVPHIISITRDVTERKRSEQARLDLERQLQQAQRLESLGVLAGGIAHDFNNILTVVLGNTELAMSRLSRSAPVRKHLLEIAQASHRAAGLCRQMLAYSGRGQFVIEPIDLRSLVEDLLELLKGSISKKAVLDLRLETHLPPILGDASQLGQVIMNLALNASESIGERSGTITISTGVMECSREYLHETYGESLTPGLYVTLEVSDTGIGMDRATQDRLFEPFFTTKFAGRGLGLSAVLGIVRSHRGALKVQSDLGRGTTFRILFPAAPDEAAADPETDRATADAWRGRGTVLLVDDEDAIRALGTHMLSHLGFQVVTAADGLEALDVFGQRRGEISAILLDLTMPLMDGVEAFREIRRIDPDVPVIMSSGYADVDVDVLSGFEGKGPAGFVSKPYTLAQLREQLRAAMTGADPGALRP